MRIKEIKIKNFRSYYGENNCFEFSDGLTVIIGDNGDGKTTFFEALQWLLDTSATTKGSLSHVSEMRKSKMEVGDIITVSVSMKFEHYGEKGVKKSFKVEKRVDSEGKVYFLPKAVEYTGFKCMGSERENLKDTDVKQQINVAYDDFIQRFSMFKGESDLNVFDNPTTLKKLVDKFSDIRKFDDLEVISKSFAGKSGKAYDNEIKTDKKISKEATRITGEIGSLSAEMSETNNELYEKRKSYDSYSERLNKLEENKDASEKFQDLQERIKSREDKAIKLEAQIYREIYNHCLLDEMWILLPFVPVLDEFKTKISAVSKERRRLQREFDTERDKRIGKIEALKEVTQKLPNGALGLPWYLPDQETMEEMISDKVCKVCGRSVENDQKAYQFMIDKLENFKKHVEREAQKQDRIDKLQAKECFKSRYVETLHNRSIALASTKTAKVANLLTEVQDLLAHKDECKKTLAVLQKEIDKLKDEKTRLLIQGNFSESDLELEFRNLKGLYDSKERVLKRISELEVTKREQEQRMASLQQEKNNLNPESSLAGALKKVNILLQNVTEAVTRAKKDNLKRFLEELEEKANNYLVRLSSYDFHGEIRLIQTTHDSTEIKLYSSNGTEIENPSGSQRTVMYISVLFAISDFTAEKREEDYPLIFDAATSSFGDSKEEEFYNVIAKIDKQCIIATKDFIVNGDVEMSAVENLEGTVYRIKKADGFDQMNMATIRTTIEKLR